MQERRSPLPLLAHSPPPEGVEGDPYSRHIEAVRRGARERAEAMLRHGVKPAGSLLGAIDAAATFHDLGKLDPDIQAALCRGRGSKLPWDHIDAGVAHLSSAQNWMAAWLVRAHHAPGLPEKQEHFNPDGVGYRLRGRRRAGVDRQSHDDQITRTDKYLKQYLELHQAVVTPCAPERQRPIHGLTMRLALSCLVDADHSDTAFFDSGRLQPEAPEPRWAERLEALCQYVRSLPSGAIDTERARNKRRAAFFDACVKARIEGPMASCEGPVGIGKTTAVVGYLLRRAHEDGLRRLIVVAPYINILTQTACRLRKALTLPGERPSEVVAEHHHKADFHAQEDRELAVLWRAPIVVTTAVSFFQTLAACDPATLRKFHEVPGSGVFLDEAHAALPTKLWPQNWRWLRELAEGWGCRFVFASGSLARFWEEGEIVAEPLQVPDLLPTDQLEDILAAEGRRVRYRRVSDGNVVHISELMEHVTKAPGPRLVILNTVQNAAVVAKAMRKAGLSVLHLSTALTPCDRDRILRQVTRRLDGGEADWALVATSCVEAGVDLSFRSAFRERFAVSSTIQVGGRVNRHGEFDPEGGGVVYDFGLDDEGITQHPEAEFSADVLRELLAADALDGASPADVVTQAMRQELARRGGLGSDLLSDAERKINYPAVERHGRVIDASTCFVVVDQRLKRLLAGRRAISYRALLRGSVQIWATKIRKLGLQPLTGHEDIYGWNAAYDPHFLGYMEGVLSNEQFLRDGGAII